MEKEKDKDALVSSLLERIRKLLLNPKCENENTFILELMEILEHYERVDVARQKDFLSEDSDDNGGDYKDNYGMMTIAPSPQSYMQRGAERHTRFQQI